MQKKSYITLIGCAVFLIPAILIMFLKPFPDLGDTGTMVVAGVLITVAIWIFKPFKLPFSMGGIFLAMWLLILGVKPAVVFAGFTQSAIWTLIPALFFGFVLQKTGLGTRLAMLVMGLIKKPTYIKLMLAWVFIGIGLSILTPSITVRVVIIVPIAAKSCELFGIEKNSRGNSLILLVAFAMALIPGTGWLTGSLGGPILQGLFGAVPELNGMLTFSSWLSTSFLPMEIATVLMLVLGYLFLRPKDKLAAAVSPELEAAKNTPWSSKEKITCIILCSVFALFATSKIHGIPDTAVCLLALLLFFVLDILDSKDIGTGISWDLVMFIAFSLSLGSVFGSTGVSAWLSALVVGMLAPVSSSSWLLIYTIAIFLFAWRFLDIAILMPTMALLVPVLPAISSAYGISPLVWTTLFVMALNCFFMPYQNMWALMSQSITGDRCWAPKHLSAYGLAYFLACMAALAVAIPYWTSQGLIK